MIEAGVHFGHQSKYWNPKMRPFIYTTYKKLHIINLEKSIVYFNSAINFIEKLAKNNSKILFVGTKRAARNLIAKYAQESKMPYVNNRWLGGMLTNFDTVKNSIQKLDNLKSFLSSSNLENMTKKESLVIKKKIAKLEKNLFGIKDLEKLPDALFVIDTKYERIAIQEANKLNIPVVAIVDSNNSFDGVDYMIPGNDDSMSSIELFIKEISETIMKTKSKFSKPVTKDSDNEKTATAKPKSLKRKQVINVEPKQDKPKTRAKKITKVDTDSKKETTKV
jgi:small subunit ribosomal protein S2